MKHINYFGIFFFFTDDYVLLTMGAIFLTNGPEFNFVMFKRTAVTSWHSPSRALVVFITVDEQPTTDIYICMAMEYLLLVGRWNIKVLSYAVSVLLTHLVILF